MNLHLLDRDTLRVVLAVAELTLAPIVALIWKGNKDVKGVNWWIAGSVSTMIGFSIPIFVELKAPAARFINDFFGIMALAFMLHGTLHFRGKTKLARITFLAMPWFAVVMIVTMAAVYGKDAARYLILDAVVVAFTLGMAYHIAHWNWPVRFSAQNLSALYLTSLSIAFCLRWSFIFFAEDRAAVIQSPYHAYLYLVLISFTIAWNCCIILVCEESAHKKVDSIANTDPLTSLPNRRSFDVILNESIERAKRETHRFALALIDLDEFKQINDRHGHSVGDQVLVEFAQRLKKHARNTDFVARLGGDEFVMIIRDAENAKNLHFIVDRLKPHLNGFALLGHSQPIEIKVSIGGAVWPQDGESSRDILRNADMRMYEDKKLRKAPAC
ncbi:MULTISPECIES: diguanylate cyclase [unclassified Acidovorax]|uniref:GGDEF domain-containing protein n=1 Tax=unclassified Acidovorax TaxID=2684926 RepID=UPI001C44E1E0|nr:MULTISPECIES: GGDEF domain-containing protein [unclassified Acidovorax]MBV7427174.1 GGDEF domain-containing protein [Acidovorax sp. sif0732]MBV7448298.1 GGDEF domain-containing protein [Acidovorax sp. sif0715]